MNQHIIIENDSDCCGCKNCLNICPKKAISFHKNKEGFYYPKVDESKCINCGLCKRKCPMINKIAYSSNDIVKCYAASNLSKEEINLSTSGGVFFLLAKQIINENGFVCGAILDEKMKIRHIITNDTKELVKMLGSKYVASDLTDIFTEIKKLLNDKHKVLFSGVPCQIAALRLFLDKEYDNLYLIDIICHGTPNQLSFDKYISFLEKRYKGKIVGYKFRSKRNTHWGTFKAEVEIQSDNETKIKMLNADFDKYYMSFLNADNYRESCYKCQFARKERISDITLGDFWGVEKLDKSIIKNNGVSAVIISSKKGEKLFNQIKNQMQSFEVEYKFIYENNGQLNHPSTRTVKRDSWYKNINDDDFIDNIDYRPDFKAYLKLLIPSKIKLYLKRIKK